MQISCKCVYPCCTPLDHYTLEIMHPIIHGWTHSGNIVRNVESCVTAFLTISYPESSGFLVSGATPGRLWGHRKNSIFLIGCSVTVSIVLPQKSCGNKIRCPKSLPGVAPLTKKPEDSGYEIAFLTDGK